MIAESIDLSSFERPLADDETTASAYTAMQQLLANVTFCDISPEAGALNVDDRFLKLFKLAQYMIEYLLISQDNLQLEIESLESELKKRSREKRRVEAELKQTMKDWSTELRKQAMSQLHPIPVHVCHICSKTFMSDYFLNVHIVNKHGARFDDSKDLHKTDPPIVAPSLSQSSRLKKQDFKSDSPSRSSKENSISTEEQEKKIMSTLNSIEREKKERTGRAGEMVSVEVDPLHSSPSGSVQQQTQEIEERNDGDDRKDGDDKEAEEDGDEDSYLQTLWENNTESSPRNLPASSQQSTRRDSQVSTNENASSVASIWDVDIGEPPDRNMQQPKTRPRVASIDSLNECFPPTIPQK